MESVAFELFSVFHIDSPAKSSTAVFRILSNLETSHQIANLVREKLLFSLHFRALINSRHLLPRACFDFKLTCHLRHFPPLISLSTSQQSAAMSLMKSRQVQNNHPAPSSKNADPATPNDQRRPALSPRLQSALDLNRFSQSSTTSSELSHKTNASSNRLRLQRRTISYSFSV